MAIIDLVDQNITDTPDPIVLEADTEAELRVIDCKYNKKPEKNNGNPYLMIRFEVIDEPLAKDISKFFALPCSGVDVKKNEQNKRTLKYFGEAFGIDFNRPFEDEDLVGLEGCCILGYENTDQYGEQNFIKRFVTGA
jgi:hypothetical protein